jgi:hypothetical protein
MWPLSFGQGQARDLARLEDSLAVCVPERVDPIVKGVAGISLGFHKFK